MNGLKNWHSSRYQNKILYEIFPISFHLKVRKFHQISPWNTFGTTSQKSKISNTEINSQLHPYFLYIICSREETRKFSWSNISQSFLGSGMPFLNVFFSNLLFNSLSPKVTIKNIPAYFVSYISYISHWENLFLVGHFSRVMKFFFLMTLVLLCHDLNLLELV